MLAILKVNMGWHILKELWKESPTEEGKVKVAAQWSLYLMPLSMNSNHHLWISQKIFEDKPHPDL